MDYANQYRETVSTTALCEQRASNFAQAPLDKSARTSDASRVSGLPGISAVFAANGQPAPSSMQISANFAAFCRQMSASVAFCRMAGGVWFERGR